MGSRGQIFSMLIITVFFFLSIFSWVPTSEASPLTTAIPSLQEEPPTVDVSPGSSGIVEMDGEITCEKYGPDDVKVFLTGSSDFGPAPVEPSSYVFSGVSGSVETRPYKVSTRIPTGTSSSLTPTITVYGYYDQGGLRSTVPPASQIIIILQYYKIQYFIEDKEVSVNSGEGVKIEFRVVNVGNGEDFFQIDFKNRDQLISKGFKMTEPFEVHMEEDTNKSVSVQVTAPDGVSGTHMAEISIQSQGSLESDSSVEVILHIRLVVSNSIGGHIGSFITSPLGIVIIAAVIVAVVYFYKTKKKEKETSNSD
jgi:hypothetical protein